MHEPVGAARRLRGTRFIVLAGVTALLAGLPFMFRSGGGDAAAGSRTARLNAPHPLIGKYCMSCHDAEEHKAGLSNCRMMPVAKEFKRAIAYDVDYVYKGSKFRTRLAQDPGNRLRIRVTITPQPNP